MKNLSEYKNEEALDLLADILVPLGDILADKKIMTEWKKGKLPAIAYALKKHKKSVLKIMARLDNVDVKDYECNMVTLPKQILAILNDTDLAGFFVSSFAQKDEQ